MSTHPKKPIEELPLQQIRATHLHPIGREAFVLQIPRLADFVPGQVIALTTDNQIPPRLFSICSGTNDERWEILFNIKHDGMLSPRLARIMPGDTLHVSMPFGSFTDDTSPAWWIAAGTGIAPFRAMLRSGQATRKHLIHGARHPHGFYFAAECTHHLGSRYTRCCSQGGAPDAYAGRLTNWLREQATLPPTANYLLCGSAEMVVEVRDILIAKQIPLDNIRSEIYF